MGEQGGRRCCGSFFSHKAKEAAWAKYETGEMRGQRIALLRCDLDNIAIEERGFIAGDPPGVESLGSFAKIKEKFYFTAMALEVLSLIVSDRIWKKIDQKKKRKTKLPPTLPPNGEGWVA